MTDHPSHPGEQSPNDPLTPGLPPPADPWSTTDPLSAAPMLPPDPLAPSLPPTSTDSPSSPAAPSSPAPSSPAAPSPAAASSPAAPSPAPSSPAVPPTAFPPEAYTPPQSAPADPNAPQVSAYPDPSPYAATPYPGAPQPGASQPGYPAPPYPDPSQPPYAATPYPGAPQSPYPAPPYPGAPGSPYPGSPYAPLQPAQYAGMSPVRPLQDPARLATIGLGLYIANLVVALVLAPFADRFGSGPLVVSALATFALLIFTGVCFIVWLHRASTNLWRTGHPMRWRPGWTIGSWFIPIAGLVLAPLVFREVDRQSRDHGPGLFAVWAVSWTATLVLDRYDIDTGYSPGDPYSLLIVAAYIVAAVSAIRLIARITADQEHLTHPR
ncbi:DUF4328 domain-containing protein [Actinoplanes sp. NPDC051851]|uniref:DUF4328 domain-containing protein n=1 Tax=Actinoplanes sp. NPDC051851 TaxID=3154753 RepID=UPI003421D02B